MLDTRNGMSHDEMKPAQQKQTPQPAALAPLPEAPFSWTARVTSPEGFEELFTVRADTAGCFFPTLEVTKEYLAENGYKPISRGNSSGSARTHEEPPPKRRSARPDWCSIHGEEMGRKERGGDVWYSHKHEGGWCRGEE